MFKFISKTILVLSLFLFSTVSSFSFEPNNTKCIAPANAGGGWDFTCRAVGKALQDLSIINGSLEVTNMAGGGGGKAFAEVVNKRGSDDSLIVAASAATATRLAQGAYPGNSMDQVKWVGTIGSGIFYFSPNGQQTIYHFTKENSPLPSNNINDISINPTNGKVYFATDQGLASFNTGGSSISENFSNSFVFPNPVRPQFSIQNEKIKIKRLIK